ncbi:hypothetical protein Poly24_48450 [Rosistilla carotiformis]|uniref:Uncharacterized protein n=1 Tax=Rosistilla carotiformis TaxID=2528017 RepID=A0A518JZZ8_9BACT|nr:hypothetical protein Poly24_48450 [Rosistilla carotiformis]
MIMRSQLSKLDASELAFSKHQNLDATPRRFLYSRFPGSPDVRRPRHRAIDCQSDRGRNEVRSNGVSTGARFERWVLRCYRAAVVMGIIAVLPPYPLHDAPRPIATDPRWHTHKKTAGR